MFNEEEKKIHDRISDDAKNTVQSLLACFAAYWASKDVEVSEADDGSITWVSEVIGCFDPNNATKETTSITYIYNTQDEVSRFTDIKAGEYFLLNIWWAWGGPSEEEWLKKMLECTEKLIETKIDVKVLDDDVGLNETEWYTLQALRARLEEKLREAAA